MPLRKRRLPFVGLAMAALTALLLEADAHSGRILSGRHPLVALLGSHLESLNVQRHGGPPAKRSPSRVPARC